MGANSSKLVESAIENTDSKEPVSVPSTPILAPKVCKDYEGPIGENDVLDPRSPTRNIARTPIELLSNEAEETPMKRHLILGIDPRSPSVEIQRTPIVVDAPSETNLPSKIVNKNLDKVRSCLLMCNPTIVPPKLLGSSPYTPKKPEAYKRKSFVLLETNVDYTETDLDVAIKEKYSQLAELQDPRSPTVDFVRTPVQICANAEPLDESGIESSNKEETEEEEESVATLLILNEKKPPEDEVEEQTEPDLPETLQSLQIQSAPVSPPPQIVVTPQKSKSEPVTPPHLVDIKELDKKLTDLIYEDENQVESPRVTKRRDPLMRTPLGLRNDADNQRPNRRLKVSDKPRKAASRIPVFKEKKIKVQCENMPPRGAKTRWDPKDDTMVI